MNDLQDSSPILPPSLFKFFGVLWLVGGCAGGSGAMPKGPPPEYEDEPAASATPSASTPAAAAPSATPSATSTAHAGEPAPD